MVQCGDDMRKIIILIFFSLFSIKNLFCIEWKTELKKCFITESSISLGSYEYGNIYKREKNTLVIQYNLDRFHEYSETDLKNIRNIFNDFRLEKDGYLYSKIANEPFDSKTVKDVPVIFGDCFSFAIPGMTSTIKLGSDSYKKWLYFDGKYEKKEKIRNPSSTVYNDIIKNVESSSHLIENSKGIEFDYSGNSLDWFIIHNSEWPQDEINRYCFPWVENVDGTGINEWIQFDLNIPQSVTYILNGFVDGNRMNLYHDNSRLKEAEFTGWTENGKEIKQNVHFEDFVYFKTVQFSEPVIKFRITIKEAYSGDKWQDTCISAVMFPVVGK